LQAKTGKPIPQALWVPALWRRRKRHRRRNAPARNRDRDQYAGFIDERDLAQRLFGAAGTPPGVEVRLLSCDAASGAVLLMARRPGERGGPSRQVQINAAALVMEIPIIDALDWDEPCALNRSELAFDLP